MKKLSLLLSACLLSSSAWAVNKCTSPDGSISLQDAPCSVDSKKSETVKTWGGNTVASKPASATRVDPDFTIKPPPQGEPLMAFYRRWADAEKLALATARVALAQPVASLQSLQREIEAHNPPQCLAQAKTELLSLVSRNVQVMLNFMGKEELSGMAYQFVERAKMIRAFESSMRSVKCE